jgi:hypothetical protein
LIQVPKLSRLRQEDWQTIGVQLVQRIDAIQ